MPRSRRFVPERLESRTLLTGATWGLEAIDAHDAWDQGHAGRGVVVAVIDSGIAIHSDLWANVWVNEDEIPGNGQDDDANGYIDDVFGWDFADDDSRPLDANRHGTQVAGVIAALDNRFGSTGVAPEATVMPVRVVGEDGVAGTHDIAGGIRYAVDNGADIINLSVGGLATRTLELAIRYAASHDVLVVAAAGNEDRPQPTFPAQYSATHSNVISVGAHDAVFEALETSNRVGASGAVQVDAPGTNILTTSSSNRYASASGTSIATAHVAGIAALARGAFPQAGATELRQALVRGATHEVAGSDGAGAIDVGAVFASLRPEPAAVRGLDADFDNNGWVDFWDFMVLARNFGRAGTSRSSGDANGDGVTSFTDFLRLFATFGQSVESAETAAPSRRARSEVAAEASAPSPLATDAVFLAEDTPSAAWSCRGGLTAFLGSRSDRAC